MVEGGPDIVQGQLHTLADGVLTLGDECFNGGVAIVRGVEIVAGPHIGGYAADFVGHMLAMDRIPHIGIVAGEAVGGGEPVFLPGGDEVEDVGSGAGGVAEGGEPHGGVGIVGRIRDMLGGAAAGYDYSEYHGCCCSGGCGGFLFHGARYCCCMKRSSASSISS